jgi:hypothetical protein
VVARRRQVLASFGQKTPLGGSFGNGDTAGTGKPPADPTIQPSPTRIMEGERIVFTHEMEPAHGVRVLASGDVDESLLDALDLYIKLQKKRLGVKSDKKAE